MDEATANIDPTNKNNMEALIKAELPNTAIGYTDHNPTETATNGASVVKTYTPLKDNFRDFTILLDKGTATISPPYSPMASPAA
jgi:ABC-type iron transport system FetAB ATPase subunit